MAWRGIAIGESEEAKAKTAFFVSSSFPPPSFASLMQWLDRKFPWQHVAGLLDDVRDVVSLGLTCKTLFSVCLSATVWKRHAELASSDRHDLEAAWLRLGHSWKSVFLHFSFGLNIRSECFLTFPTFLTFPV